MEIKRAREIVTIMVEILQPYCERIEIAGSIRRGNKADVKDAEIVAIPKPDLLAFTDSLIESGAVQKALYGETKTTRWGAKYRGMEYQGLKIELFLAEPDNFGAVYWLRTGPGDANEYVMAFLSWKRAPIRFQEGYCWHSSSNDWQQVEKGGKKTWVAKDRQKLCIATEHDLFAVLGMPFITPERRNEERYKMLLGDNDNHEWPQYTKYYIVATKPKTAELMPLAPYFTREEEAFPLSSYDARLDAERAYNAGVMARHLVIFERAAAGEPLEKWEARIVENRRAIEREQLMRMNVADGLSIYVDEFVGTRTAVLGSSGMGKSNLVATLCEELAGRLPLTIIDLESEYWSLREIYPFIVAGRGEHVDRVIGCEDADALADEIMFNGYSVILDLLEFDKVERNEFLRRYLERLWQIALKARQPHTIVLEECHEFIPQKASSEAMEIARRIALRGRKRGLGMILASQRSAMVNKDVLTQCNRLFLHLVQYPNDIRVYQEILPMRPGESEKLIKSLSIGQAIVRRAGADGKQRADVFQIRRRKTEDLGATPVLGGKVKESA